MTLDDSKTWSLKKQEITHFNIQYASITDIQYASITDINLKFSILVFINHTNLKFYNLSNFEKPEIT